MEAAERRAEAQAAPGPVRLDVRGAPVGGDGSIARVPGPGEDRLAERAPGAEPARVWEYGCVAEEPGVIGPVGAGVRAGLREVDRHGVADDAALVLGEEVRVRGVVP